MTYTQTNSPGAEPERERYLMSTITIPGPSFKLALYVRRIFTPLRYAGLPWVRGSPWGGFGDDLPSPADPWGFYGDF